MPTRTIVKEQSIIQANKAYQGRRTIFQYEKTIDSIQEKKEKEERKGEKEKNFVIIKQRWPLKQQNNMPIQKDVCY